jgi:hypothetical protein
MKNKKNMIEENGKKEVKKKHRKLEKILSMMI